ncbi:DUF3466 family protein [Undibacterium sp. Di27W]|uniref:DUF3466 family protein n=1 Tax=Undibacterium sp. Di27W TaxID=3413036 RepID=UPI003BF27A29
MSSNEFSFRNSSFIFADMGTFGGHTSHAYAINDAGLMVGSDTRNEPGNKFGFTPGYAAIWDNSYYVPKTTLLADHDSNAYGINNFSSIVGSSLKDIGGNSQITATVWRDGEASYLASLSNGQYKSIAKAINDQGLIVGDSFTSDTWEGQHASLWTDTGVIDLGTLGGRCSSASAINNKGVVAGCASSTKWDDVFGIEAIHPVIWKEGKIINLSPEHYGAASSINDNDLVVGSVLDDEMHSHATLWMNQKEITLQSSVDSSSYASAINNKNQVVGSEMRGFSQQHALLWNTPDSAPIDLNQYLDQSQLEAGWLLVDASDINDQGWIIGTAWNPKTYESHAFLLTVQGVTGLTDAAPAQPAQVVAATATVTVATTAAAAHVASADIWSGMY